MFHWRISLNSVLLLLLVNFVSRFRLELMYISLIVSIRSNLPSMVISSLCCCHSSQKPLFCLYQQNKSSESKVKFRHASNQCKRVLEAAKHVYANRTKDSLLYLMHVIACAHTSTNVSSLMHVKNCMQQFCSTLPVSHQVGANTDLPSNSNFSKTLRVNLASQKPYLKSIE